MCKGSGRQLVAEEMWTRAGGKSRTPPEGDIVRGGMPGRVMVRLMVRVSCKINLPLCRRSLLGWPAAFSCANPLARRVGADLDYIY